MIQATITLKEGFSIGNYDFACHKVGDSPTFQALPTFSGIGTGNYVYNARRKTDSKSFSREKAINLFSPTPPSSCSMSFVGIAKKQALIAGIGTGGSNLGTGGTASETGGTNGSGGGTPTNNGATVPPAPASLFTNTTNNTSQDSDDPILSVNIEIF